MVEDEASLQDLARTILEGQGYSVTTAANGQEALAAADNDDKPFDLLLTDVIMPGISGRVLADQLSKKYPALKVLYMSGYTDNAIVHYGILEPGIEFIHKPFSPVALSRKIRSLLDRTS
ncbi:MAG: response regulator [Desulfoprunum sp.]|nr:response regulator [Desulfoprunum sp.]